ncbi:MAG: hypothetical protein SFZ24_10175 [Planctomycetota bacterium]|nr:hypothetical protein [Planctomycetota bacterium]
MPRPIDLPTVQDECKCRNCGYSLRGLPESGQCPECGTPVLESLNRGAGARLVQLTSTPRGWVGNEPLLYLLRLTLGMAMLIVGIAPVSLTAMDGWLAAFGGDRGPMPMLDPPLAWVAFGGAVLWTAGLALLSYPRSAKGGGEEERRRLAREVGGTKCAALITQLVWPAMPVVAAALSGSGFFTPVVALLVLVGVFGLGAVARLMEYFTAGVNDLDVENMLDRVAFWLFVLPALSLVCLILLRTLPEWSLLFVAMVNSVLTLGWVVCVAYLGWSMVNLVRLTGWARRNARERAEMDARKLERARRAAQMGTPEAMQEGFALAAGGMLGGRPPAPPEPQPLPTGPLPGQNTPRISKSGAAPYALEDDPPR